MREARVLSIWDPLTVGVWGFFLIDLLEISWITRLYSLCSDLYSKAGVQLRTLGYPFHSSLYFLVYGLTWRPHNKLYCDEWQDVFLPAVLTPKCCWTKLFLCLKVVLLNFKLMAISLMAAEGMDEVTLDTYTSKYLLLTKSCVLKPRQCCSIPESVPVPSMDFRYFRCCLCKAVVFMQGRGEWCLVGLMSQIELLFFNFF